ncbi:MAG: LarC family nickel insertion protein [Anaerolineae bacterium]|nr:LarC family nickel insertion protein [Anaerolineae bacterium]
MTRIAYLDCFAGISGDMLLGALVDAGWAPERLQTVVDALKLEGVTIRAESVSKHHLAGTQVSVLAPDAQPLRHPADLVKLIEQADLPASIRSRATNVIMALANAEARVHGEPVESIHFHEIGAVDTLVDVVGAVAGLEALGVEQVVCAPLPWSHGTIRISHGDFPVPPPAVAALLKGVPVVGVDVEGEMVTPTGAALAVSLAGSFGLIPSMTVTGIGYGAGMRDWPDRPNLLRLVLGE